MASAVHPVQPQPRRNHVFLNPGPHLGCGIRFVPELFERLEPPLHLVYAGVRPHGWFGDFLGWNDGLELEAAIPRIGGPMIVLPAFDLIRNPEGECATVPLGLVVVTAAHAGARWDLDRGFLQFIHSSLTGSVSFPESDRPRRNPCFGASIHVHAPGRTRTCDPRLRRPMLYPPELRALWDRKLIQVLHEAQEAENRKNPPPLPVQSVASTTPS